MARGVELKGDLDFQLQLVLNQGGGVKWQSKGRLGQAACLLRSDLSRHRALSHNIALSL